MATKEEVLAEIARKHVGVPTLEARHSDRLDFHEVGVWQLREALGAAYQAGAGQASGACALCGEPLGPESHNAAPLANGRCCNACHPKVLSERFRLATDEDLKPVWTEGKEAYLPGPCPYPDGSPPALAWLRGYATALAGHLHEIMRASQQGGGRR